MGALVGGQLPLNAAPPAPAQSGPAASTANNSGITQRSSRRRWTKESALQRYSARQPRKTTRVTPYLAGPERPGFLESPIPTTLSGQGAGNTRAGHSTAIVITDTNDPAPEKPVKSEAIAERQTKEESQQQRPADSVAAPSQQVASKPAPLLTPEKSEAGPSEPTPAAKPKPDSNLAEKSDKVETPTPIEEPTPAAAKPKLTSIPKQASPRTPAPAVALEAPVESGDALPAEPAPKGPQSPATENSSIYSMVPTPAVEPEQTASAPQPNPQLEEAKCVLRLFNAFGLKEKAEKPTDGLKELAESTPTMAERPSSKPTSLQPATAPAMIAASPTTSRYTAVPQSAPEHCDELKPGVEVDNSTTTPIEPPMLAQTPEVTPGTAEPSDSEQSEESGSLVDMKDLQGPRHLRPAPSTPAPTALAEVGPDSTKTYRVFDESSEEDEKASAEPATVAQTPKTTEAAPKQSSLATARPNKSGRDVRKRLRLAIDELVGGPVRPRTEKPQPKKSSSDRTQPSESLAAKSPATATQPKTAAKVPAQSQDLASVERDSNSGTVQPSETAKLASRPKAQPEATQPAKPRVEKGQLAEASRPETQPVKPSQPATETRQTELAQNQPNQVSKPELNPRGSARPQAEPRVAEVVPPVVQEERRLVPRNPRPQVANTQRPNTQLPDTAREVPQLAESKYANRPEPSVPVQQRPNVEANRPPAQDLASVDPTPQVRPRPTKRPAFRVIGDSPPMQRARTPQQTQGGVPAESALASSGRQPSLLSRPRTAAVTPVPPRIWESPQTVRPASPTSAVMPERARPTKEVRVAERTSYPLQAPGRVTRITVVDRNVCDVVQHSPYELALIGKHTGQTDVAVWLEGQPTAQVYRIVVGRGGVQPVDQGKLQSLVADLFPESRVTITQRGEAVYVDGVAMNRQEAIKILSVVRSVKLIPVVDNLEVLRR